MSLNNFKELLLRKTAGTPLQPIIQYMGEEQLSSFVMDSLEKMAQNPNVKGKDANYMVRDFASKAHGDTMGHMMRDALSHHVSHYKKNLESGNKDDAHAHAKQAQKIMNLAAKSQIHSNGQISLDHVDFHPWERQQFGKRKTNKKTGEVVGHGKNSKDDYVRNTKGLNLSNTNHKDYSFLEGSPHWSHGHKAEMNTHRGSYPWEDVKLSGKHLHVDDVEPQEGGFKANQHAFDNHPIMDYHDKHYNFKSSFDSPEQADVAAEKLSNKKMEDHQDYDNRLNQWRQEHLPAWLDHHEEQQKADPDAYAQRGLNKPDKVLPALEDHDPETHGDYESHEGAHRKFRLPKDHMPTAERERMQAAQQQREDDAGVKTMDASGKEIKKPKVERKAPAKSGVSGKSIKVGDHELSSMDDLADAMADGRVSMDDLTPDHHDVMNSWGKK